MSSETLEPPDRIGRGKGLLNAVVIRNQPGKTAWDVW